MAKQSITNSALFTIIKLISRVLIILTFPAFALMIVHATEYVNQLPEPVHNLIISLPIYEVEIFLTIIVAPLLISAAVQFFENHQLNKLCQPSEYANYDPQVAKNLKWSPKAIGGYQTKLHKLVQSKPSMMQLKQCKTSMMKSIISIILATVSFIVISIASEIMLMLVIMAIFILILCFTMFKQWKYASTPRNFDKLTGYYWQGDESLTQINQIKRTKDATLLSNIIGIQILDKKIGNKKAKNTSYELNLILKSNERINVTDHGDRGTIINNANALSAFLNVPVYLRPKD